MSRIKANPQGVATTVGAVLDAFADNTLDFPSRQPYAKVAERSGVSTGALQVGHLAVSTLLEDCLEEGGVAKRLRPAAARALIHAAQLVHARHSVDSPQLRDALKALGTQSGLSHERATTLLGTFVAALKERARTEIRTIADEAHAVVNGGGRNSAKTTPHKNQLSAEEKYDVRKALLLAADDAAVEQCRQDFIDRYGEAQKHQFGAFKAWRGMAARRFLEENHGMDRAAAEAAAPRIREVAGAFLGHNDKRKLDQDARRLHSEIGIDKEIIKAAVRHIIEKLSKD